MSGAFGALRDGAAEQLRACGVHAVTAMEPESRSRWREPVVAVGLGKIACQSGGFQDYLGSRERDGLVQELYGRAAEVTLTLDIYAPRDGGESACWETLEAAAEAMLCQGAAGLYAAELWAEGVEFLEREGLYRLRASCLCKVWLVASADGTDGVFTDFEVKGRRV